MLAYLEELCSALLAHDSATVHRLLGHPLARSLPRQVREEALAISRANSSSLRAPIQVLHSTTRHCSSGSPSRPPRRKSATRATSSSLNAPPDRSPSALSTAHPAGRGCAPRLSLRLPRSDRIAARATHRSGGGVTFGSRRPRDRATG